MKPRPFLLGLLTGFVMTLVILGLVFAVLLTRPVPVAAPPPSASDADVVLSLNEGYLSGLATALAQVEESVIRNVTVDFHPGGLVDVAVEGQLKVLGIQIAPKAIIGGFVELSDGRLTFSLQTITAAGISIPRGALIGPLKTAVRAMEEALNQSMANALDENRLKPVGLNSDEATITVGFKAK